MYVYPTVPEVPSKPSYYPVRWISVQDMYCTDERGKNNLIKNKEIDSFYQNDLLTVIETVNKQIKK